MKLWERLMRCASVSVVSTIVSTTVLGVLVYSAVVNAVTANVVATAIATIPSFELNRRWVWRKVGRRSIGGEVVPFCLLSAAGLVLSTIAVATATGYVSHLGYGAATRTVAAEGASLAAFGALWVVQFVILDRKLFRVEPARSTSFLATS